MNNTLLFIPMFALLAPVSRPAFGQDAHDHGAAHSTTATAPATMRPEHDDHDHDHSKPAAPAPSGDDHDDHDDHAAPSPKSGHDHDDGHGEHDDDHDHGGEAHADEVTISADAIERNGIKVGKAERRVLTGVVVAPGRVAFDAEAMAHVGAAVRGRATDIKVRVGDVVKKGDELLVIESPELGEAQSDVLQKRTALVVAKAAVEPTKNAYERAKLLHEKSEGIALAEVQRREAEFRAATGAVQNAEESFTAAANRLKLLGMGTADVNALVQSGRINPRLSIKAPLAGTVIEREVTLGELVSPEKERLLVVAATDHLWVLADVPEARMADVSKGADATVSVVALPGMKVDGKVSHVAPSLDPNTRTVRVRVEVPNADGKLLPGMFARVAIAGGGGGGEPVVVVPDEAVQNVEGSPAVFVPADEPNTFAKRAVKVGRAVGGMVPILSGLKEGESVVTAGSFILKADLGKSGAAHEH